MRMVISDKLEQLTLPFLFLGNSGATWRAESFTDDDGLEKDIAGINQCNCVCVLPGRGVQIGDRSTMFAYSLATSYGAHMPEARMWNPEEGIHQFMETREHPGMDKPDPDALHVMRATVGMKH